MTRVPGPAAPADEPARDDFLRAALRHAPDHALTPPSGISQAILAAARQVHRPRPATVEPPPVAERPAPVRIVPARTTPWQQRLQWLWSPRWAGGLATALVGALVIGLWFDAELPPPLTQREADAPAPVQREPAAAPVTPPPAPASEVPAPAAERQAKVIAPPREAAPEADPKRESSTGSLSRRPSAGARENTAAPAPADTTAALPTAPPPAPVPELRSRRMPSTPDAPVEARASQLNDAPQEHAATGAAAPAPKKEAAAAAPALAERAERPPAALAAAASAASPALTTWRRATHESAARSAIWTWQPGTAPTPRSFDAEGQAWLLRVVQTARGRWVDVASDSDGAAALEVRWWRDDQPHARLRIEANGLRWIEPSGRIRYAALDAKAIERLREF